MSDYFEIDFLDVASKKSGDAIPLRYSIDGVTRIHITDGGFQDTGTTVLDHLKKYYGDPSRIDSVVVTHPDGDHAGGLRTVLESLDVDALWMLRPWEYADELIHRFSRFTNTENLIKRLKEIYPNIAALEDIALREGIPICEPFQGAQIGAFTVLAPSKNRYLDLVVESEKTPESTKAAEESALAALGQLVEKAAAYAIAFVRAAWGEETFSPEGTSAENDMSVVQYAHLCGRDIVLTGDAGCGALSEAADFAPLAGLVLPGVDRIQVPHHGSRRNVSTEVLDRWLGPRLPAQPAEGTEKIHAFISASKDDKDHPRKAVIRAFIHRGAKVCSTEGSNLRTSQNAPNREGWSSATPLKYPEDQEQN